MPVEPDPGASLTSGARRADRAWARSLSCQSRPPLAACNGKHHDWGLVIYPDIQWAPRIRALIDFNVDVMRQEPRSRAGTGVSHGVAPRESRTEQLC